MKPTDQLPTFQRWLTEHRGLLLKVVRSFSRDSNDQEDLFQEITLQVWNSLAGYHGQVAETTWIYRVALYSAIAWARKEKSREKNRLELIDPETVRSPSESTEDARIDWLYEQIKNMDEVDRSLALLLLDGFSYRQMADTLGMTVSNVGVRISRIKKRLIKDSERERSI